MSIPLASKASGQVTVVDVTDAYSVLLTSESYTFVGNTTGAPSGLSCATQVVAYCGTQRCSKISISTVTCPTGISATISNNNTSSPTITFETTATITAACEATIPVVVDGVTINKQFSFAVAKQGGTGLDGKGIKSTTITYQTSSSGATAPTGTWSETIPSTDPSNPYLWTRTVVTYTDDTTSTSYSVSSTLEGVSVGGRNLILKSDVWTAINYEAPGITSSITDGVLKVVSTSGNAGWQSFSKDNVIEDNLNTGDTFTFGIEIKSEDGTCPPNIYFKPGMGYYPLKGTVSSDYSWCYYTGTWNKTNDIHFHFGWESAIGTYYIRKIKFEKGNIATDWTPAPEDQESNVTSKIEQLKDSITLTVSGVNSTATEALNKANSAKEYIDAVSTQYGYPYSTELIIYGARTDYYYPVYFGFGNQSIPREILVSRWYGMQAPSDWNTSTHAGSLTFRIKAIFGGWGGADYQCEILDFSEEYSTIVGDVEVGVMNGYGLCIWLRGGGTTGAKYNVHSDQPLEYTSDSNDWHAVLPYIGVTTGTQFGWNGGTESSPKHSWTAAAPLTSPNTTHLNSLWALKTATTASSRIEQLKDSITLSVTDGTVGNTAKIKLGIDNETREANIDLTGAVTFSDLSTAGSTTINGSNITTGTLSADLITTGTLSSDRLDTSALFANDITATGKIQFDNGRYSLLIDETSKKISLDSWGELYMEGNPVRIHSPVGYITLSAANGIRLQTSGDLTIGDKKLESGYWTPTLSGMSAYSYQKGRYFKFGDIAIVSFSIWGIMAGSSTEQIKISGCPLVPTDGGYAGGGSLSGYYTTDNTVFTSWVTSTDGSFYAYGQISGVGSKWESSGIYQKTSGECGGGGTIMFKTSS